MTRKGNLFVGLHVLDAKKKDGVYSVAGVVSDDNNRGHASIYKVHTCCPRDPNDRRNGCAKVSAVRNSIDTEPGTPSLPHVR